jgi:hypothetical protein
MALNVAHSLCSEKAESQRNEKGENRLFWEAKLLLAARYRRAGSVLLEI